MSMSDFIIYTDLICEANSPKEKVREATQADIDRLLG
jgi:hypothetical protein